MRFILLALLLFASTANAYLTCETPHADSAGEDPGPLFGFT